jgi:hypothetical protein
MVYNVKGTARPQAHNTRAHDGRTFGRALLNSSWAQQVVLPPPRAGAVHEISHSLPPARGGVGTRDVIRHGRLPRAQDVQEFYSESCTLSLMPKALAYFSSVESRMSSA